MARSTPLLSERASGLLVGLAAGNALGLPAEPLATAAAIAGRFPDGLHDIIREDTPESPFDDDTALAVILAEELASPPLDFATVAHRWVDWARQDGRGIGDWTARALNHIATHDSPPASTGGVATNGALTRCLPIALVAFGSPRNLVSATFHAAALTHPDPRCTWGAVAVNVAAARLLQASRDFLPDVIEALQANDAPAELLSAIRRVPVIEFAELPIEGEEGRGAVAAAQIALWTAHHEPILERGLTRLANAGGDTDTNAALAGALLGARDGEAAIPARWLSQIPQVSHLRSLATQLARVTKERTSP
ncbi:MAG TPA: ADP-ribosylglycohydrolase family protein [Gemmatimonadales bacterium]|nr:ADP-ribosylglycohydrolase family protein [Gemmatimonadales bacterium]